jgi:HAMP domain-containing protein
MLLTFYLTRPITKLQSAAQRLANGGLDARAAR